MTEEAGELQIMCISIFKTAFPVLLGNQEFAFDRCAHRDCEIGVIIKAIDEMI